MTTDMGLREHLVATRIAGDVATSREDNLKNFGRMAQGRENYDFGLVPRRTWTRDEVLEVMVRLCGVHPDPAYAAGPDTIDPGLTIAALDRWRERLAKAAASGERVALATGHPTGVLSLHLQVAAALRLAGCEVLVPALDWSWPWEQEWGGGRDRHVRCVGGVHVLASGGELLHTHRPEPMHALLAALGEPPDLVVADHGWAGVAAEAGIETLALADCNDPALFVGEAEGKPLVTVPLDDNVLPQHYDRLGAHVLEGWAERVPVGASRTEPNG
jgi:hypothetical protein